MLADHDAFVQACSLDAGAWRTIHLGAHGRTYQTEFSAVAGVDSPHAQGAGTMTATDGRLLPAVAVHRLIKNAPSNSGIGLRG
jgi:hypothetical protein